MGWDVFCGICGLSCKGCGYEYLEDILNTSDNELKKISKDCNWLNKKIILNSNNKIKKFKYEEVENHLPFIADQIEYGILLHYDCWKFVKINYGIELQYKHLPINYKIFKSGSGTPPLMKINYGEIKKYWGQDMDFEKMYKDNNMYMIQNPLIPSNTKNISRIKKIISQFKLKKEQRPSPSISATFYKNNIIKIGNNNKFWIIKNNKWNEIKEDVIKKSFNIKSNKLSYFGQGNIPQIGEYNTVPLFINKIKNYFNKKKPDILEIIGTDKTIEEFKNNILYNKHFV
jgi:hypothetical protein